MDWPSIIWNTFLDITGITKWLENREQQKIGEQKQVNVDLRADLAAQERINDAEANTPKTDADWEKAAKGGKL